MILERIREDLLDRLANPPMTVKPIILHPPLDVESYMAWIDRNKLLLKGLFLSAD